MSDTLKSFLVISILFLISLAWWVFEFKMIHDASLEIKQLPRAIIEPQVVFEGELVIVQGNSLIGLSYLPIIPEVRAEIISEPIDYCGVAWLSNFWPDFLVRDASKICIEESHGEHWRVNDGWWKVKELSCGLFQINVLAHPEYNCEEMKNPEANVKAAIKIYENEGWGAWKNSAIKAGIIK